MNKTTWNGPPLFALLATGFTASAQTVFTEKAAVTRYAGCSPYPIGNNRQRSYHHQPYQKPAGHFLLGIHFFKIQTENKLINTLKLSIVP